MGEDKLDALNYGVYIGSNWVGRVKTLEAKPEETSESKKMLPIGEACRKGIEAGIKNTVPEITFKPSKDAKLRAKDFYDAVSSTECPKWPTIKYQQEPVKSITINSGWGLKGGDDAFRKSLFPEPFDPVAEVYKRLKYDLLAMPERDLFKPIMVDEKTMKFLRKYLGENDMNRKFEIKNVIFNNPATIVFWADGTKTVVKAQNGEKFDPEKGLAMAITKRVFGDKGNYFNEVKKWLPKDGE